MTKTIPWIFEDVGLNGSQDDEPPPIFQEVEKEKDQVIPPIGIAAPEFVDAFMQKMHDENSLKSHIDELTRRKKESVPQTVAREYLSHVARGTEALGAGLGTFLTLLTPEMFENEEGEIIPLGERGYPSAEELREVTKGFTGEYLEPMSDIEKTSQEYISDVGSFMSSGANPLFSVLLPLGGQAIKQSLRQAGEPEDIQNTGKLAFMGLATIAGLGNAPRVASNAMSEAKALIPKGLRFAAKDTENLINKIHKSSWFKSGSTASKEPALKELRRIEENLIKTNYGNVIDGQVAMQIRHDINEARKKLDAFSLDPIPDKAAARFYLDQVDQAMLASMENYGKHVNPKWWKQYNLANEAFGVTKRSRQISDFLGKHAKPLQSETAKILFHTAGGAAASGALGGTLATGAIFAAPVMGAAKTVQIMNRMIKSSILRKHYTQVLKAASVQNAAMLDKELKAFDSAAMKYEKAKDHNSKINQ